MHPRLFMTAKKTPGLRSLQEVREYLRTDSGRISWDRLVDRLKWYMSYPPFDLQTPLPGRKSFFAGSERFDYYLSMSVGQRVLCGARAFLGKPFTAKELEAVLRQGLAR